MTRADAARFDRVLDYLMWGSGERAEVEKDLLELTLSARAARPEGGPAFSEVRNHLPRLMWLPVTGRAAHAIE
jgi:hypothetical protein